MSFVDATNSNAIIASATLGSGSTTLQFVNASNPATVSEPNAVATADFNGDGIPDLAVSNSNSGATDLTILLGKGDGTFSRVSTSPTVGLYPDSIAVGDFNGDGFVDLAVSSVDDDKVTILLGNGDGTFTSAPALSTTNIPQSVAAADFNGDGIPDLAVVASSSIGGGSSVLIFLGKGDGTFALAPSSPNPGASAITVVVGDFNRDGIADLAVTNGTTTGLVTILLGNGDGTFRAGPGPLQAGTSAVGLTVADLNNDGILDLAATNYLNSGVNIFLGNGDGTFQSAVNYAVPFLSARSVLAADFNGDGIADLAIGKFWQANPSIFLGNGDGTFGSPILLGGNELALASGHIASADFNGDGIPDIVEPNQDVAGTAAIELVQPSHVVTATVTNFSLVGPGPHMVEANYAGDSNYSGSVSATTSLTVVVATPVISPGPGIYTSVQSVAVTDSTPGATIYYSATGTVNTNGFVPYPGPIALNLGGRERITAYATETGYQQSGYTTATFTLNLPIAPTPVISPAAGSYSGQQTVTITDTASGATIYYTTDGSQPTTKSAVYTGPITVSTSQTIAALVTAGGYSTSATAYQQYFINNSQSSFAYTIAGNGLWGLSGDGGPATVASLNFPTGIAVDKAGNRYIADTGNNVVRKVAAGSGIITTFAGTGIAGYSGDNGSAITAQLNAPWALAVDGAGNLYIADSGNRVVRMVAAGTGVITTYAGSATATSLGDGGLATSAQLSSAYGVAFDATGNLYISDGQRVRKVTASTGIITTFAGTGTYGYSGDNGPATSAAIGVAQGLASDGNGNLYISDTGNNVVRKVGLSTGSITTVAGTVHTSGSSYGGDGGPALSAMLYDPYAIAVDGAGNLFISDTLNNAVREVTASNGFINTIMGHPPSDCSGLVGDGGPALSSAICAPEGLTFDAAGNLLVVENGSSRVREITLPMLPPTTATATPVVDVLPGSYAGSQKVNITDAIPGAKIYVTVDGSAPTTNSSGYRGTINVTGSATLQAIAAAPGKLQSAPLKVVYTITTPPAAVITTVAGNGVAGLSGAGGQATSAELGLPSGVAFDSKGNLYIADSDDSVVWKVDSGTGTISVVAGTLGLWGESGDGGLATSAQLYSPTHIAFDKANNLYISDTQNNLIRMVSAQTGIISVYAGNNGYSWVLGDGGPATAATLVEPQGIALDSAGNLYIADQGNNRIRMVSASTGIMSTVAGGATSGLLGDGGPATSATLSYPNDVAVNPQGNLYIADGARVRVVNGSTGVITSIAGNGNHGDSGDGGSATAAEICAAGLALDRTGNIYVSSCPNVVRMVPAGGGTITPVAGNEYSTSGGDGGSATMAGLAEPTGLAFDTAGNLFIADKLNHRVRQVTFSGLPHALSFGKQFVNTTVASSVYYQNRTTASLSISKIAVSGNFKQTNNCPGTVNAGTGCTITVLSSPMSQGQQWGNLEIDDSSSASPFIVPLWVNAIASVSATPSRPGRPSRTSSTSSGSTTNITSPTPPTSKRISSPGAVHSDVVSSAAPSKMRQSTASQESDRDLNSGHLRPGAVVGNDVVATHGTSSEPHTTFDVHGPLILAYSPPAANYLRDTPAVSEQLKKQGIEFRRIEASSFSIRQGKELVNVESTKEQAGYYFVSPGKEPRIEYGPKTNADLLRIAKEYFGRRDSK